MRRGLVLVCLFLAACVQPGRDVFYPLGPLRLHAFTGGERLDFQFLGTDLAASTEDIPLVNGTRQEDWGRVANVADLDPPPGVDAGALDLLRYTWRTDFSGGWSDTLAFYLTQDPDSGALTLHALAIELGDRGVPVYWLDSPATFVPPLSAWDAPTAIDTGLERYANGAFVDRGSLRLSLSLTPRGTDTARTPLGRFESLSLELSLNLSLDDPGYNALWNGQAWLHPALGFVRYSVAFSRFVGSENRHLSLDRVELTETNVPLPPEG